MTIVLEVKNSWYNYFMTINKESVREELERLKSEFNSLRGKGKIADESVTLINGLIMLLNLLVAIFMEGFSPRRMLGYATLAPNLEYLSQN